MEGLKILIIPKGKDAAKDGSVEKFKLNAQNSEKVSRALNSLNFNELMTMNSDGTSMKFLAEDEKDNYLENLVFNVDSEDENIIFILNGKMKMSDVNKIMSSTGIAGNPAKSSQKNDVASENTSSYVNGDNRNVGEFSRIDVSVGVNVVYKQEDTRSVKVIADADKLQNVITRVDNGVLKIYVDNNGARNLRFRNLNVNVSSPRLNGIKVSSGSNFTTVNQVTEDGLDIDVESGSTVKGKFNIKRTTNVAANSGSVLRANIMTQKLMLDVTSGANVSLAGQADSATIDINSGASCKADELKIATATVESTSGASLSLLVTDKLKVSASSGADIKLKGNPEIDAKIDKMSGGSLRQIK